MNPETPKGRSSTIDALHSLLRAHGIDPKEFEFEEYESSGLTNLLGGGDCILAVRCRSSDVERLYATGADSAWYGAFMMDLGSGHFGKLLRSLA
jgi:hypothetical protein